MSDITFQEFIKKYHDIKLTPHQKFLMKMVLGGKTPRIYFPPRRTGKSFAMKALKKALDEKQA